MNYIALMARQPANAPPLESVVQQAGRFGATPEQAERIHSLVRGRQLPADVRAFEIRFGQDSTDKPAMWVVFLVDEDLKPSKDKLAKLNRFADEVQADLLKENSSFWPYVEFKAVS